MDQHPVVCYEILWIKNYRLNPTPQGRKQQQLLFILPPVTVTPSLLEIPIKRQYCWSSSSNVAHSSVPIAVLLVEVYTETPWINCLSSHEANQRFSSSVCGIIAAPPGHLHCISATQIHHRRISQQPLGEPRHKNQETSPFGRWASCFFANWSLETFWSILNGKPLVCWRCMA